MTANNDVDPMKSITARCCAPARDNVASMTITLSNHEFKTSMPTVLSPPEPIVALLEDAFSRNYGDLMAAQDSTTPHQCYMAALRELRDVIVPAWGRGERVTCNLNHATTLLGVLDAYETANLNRYAVYNDNGRVYRRSRSEQRTACRKAEPDLLKTITKTRGWVTKNIVIHQPDGRVMEIG